MGEILTPNHSAKPPYSVFTDEHDDLRASIRRYVANELTPNIDLWEKETFPSEVFPRMGELGFLGLDKPEAYGGQGGDYMAALVLAEELWYGANGGLALAVAVQTDMAMPPVLAFGTEEQKREWLAPAIAGERILCLGISEPDAGSDVAGTKTTAVRDGEDYVINGSKTYITNGHRADGIVLLARTGEDSFTLFMVDMHLPGVIREKRLAKLGMSASDTSTLAFEDVRVPQSAVLGEVGDGFQRIMWELQGERIIGAAGLLAAAQAAFDRTLEYVNTRIAFGRPVAKFQVVRHRIAEMATELESARHLAYATAKHFADGLYPVREIAMVKLNSARVAFTVADHCLQLHGGAGYMKEYEIERIWRDVRVGRIGGGTDEIMLDVIGRSYGL